MTRRWPFLVAAEKKWSSRPERADRGMRVAWLILAISLSTTLLAWVSAHRAVEEFADVRFATRRNEIVSAIDMRIDAYDQVLLGSAALFHVADEVTFNKWREYVAHLDIQRHFPGILGIGYAAYLHHGQVPAFEEVLAKQVMPPWRLHPPGDHPLYVAITYLEPLTLPNRSLLGFDMYQDPERRQALDQARDSGGLVLSGAVKHLERHEKGVRRALFMYLPVYRGEPDTVSERRNRLMGFVYAPFHMNELMHGIFGSSLQGIRVTIYDRSGGATEQKLYDSLTGHPMADEGSCDRHSTDTLVLGQRTWRVRVCSLPGFISARELLPSRIILGTGTVISLLLFGITRVLATTRRRAFIIAKKMTRELREERTRLSEIAVTLGEGLIVQDAADVITFCNPAAAQMLGWEPEMLVGRNSTEFLSPAAVDAGVASSARTFLREISPGVRYAPQETTFRRRDGTLVPVSVVSTPIAREGENMGAVIAFQDISEHLRAEAELRDAQQFAALFQYSGDALLLLNIEGAMIDANRVAQESLGYTREELLTTPIEKHVRWSTVPPPGQSFADFAQTLMENGGVSGEAELVRKDGSLFIVEATYSSIGHDSHKTILVSTRDITQRKEFEQRIQRALEDLERSRSDVEEANRKLAESNSELQRITRRDELTGIANRRFFDEYIDLEWNRASRDHRALALLMIDVDYFKNFNDHYGHQAGDDCLRRIAEQINRQLSRSIDIVARYGGEEFVVVLPETPLRGAVTIGERMRRSVEGMGIPHERSSVSRFVTISVGAAALTPHPEHKREILLSAADSALYRAKQSGRNRLVTAETPDEDT